MFSRMLANLGGRHRNVSPVEADAVESAEPRVRYLFEAEVQVSQKSWQEFDKTQGGEAGPRLVEIHKDAGLSLMHSGAQVGQEDFTFYNYWDLGFDVNALAQAELKMSDDVVWATFDLLVQRSEVKNILINTATTTLSPEARAGMSGGPDLLHKMISDKARYMRVTYDVERTKRDEFMARLEACIVPFALSHDWLLGDSFVYLTGEEGRAVQLWLVPEQPGPKAVEEIVHSMPWLLGVDGERLVNHKIEPQFYPPTPLDPVVKSIAERTK